MYQNGLGTVENADEAVRMMTASSEQGYPIAQHGLGFMYMQVKWFEKAAEEGLQSSITTLAMMYEQGEGVDKGSGKAKELYKAAGFDDLMDERMDNGIQLGVAFIETPNPLQRAQFVANSLVNSLLKQNFNQAIAMGTFLGKRMPDLQQIKCEGSLGEKAGEDGGISIEFVYDRSYEQDQQEQTIQFHKPEKPLKH
ncbi:Protein sel-1 2 [Nymphon striatum]|nr:Protein sel-1 2 [Nymphon striatum]